MNQTELKLSSDIHSEINLISSEVLNSVDYVINYDILMRLDDYLDDVITFYNTADDFTEGHLDTRTYNFRIKGLKERKKEGLFELKNIWIKYNPDVEINIWLSGIISELFLIQSKIKKTKNTILTHSVNDIVKTRFGNAKILSKHGTFYSAYFFDYRSNKILKDSEIL